MTNTFIVFAIAVSGGITAVLMVKLFAALSKPKQSATVQIVYSARLEDGLWNVYYEDSTLDDPIRIATFVTMQEAERLLATIDTGAVRKPADKPVTPVLEPLCEGRR